MEAARARLLDDSKSVQRCDGVSVVLISMSSTAVPPLPVIGVP